MIVSELKCFSLGMLNQAVYICFILLANKWLTVTLFYTMVIQHSPEFELLIYVFLVPCSRKIRIENLILQQNSSQNTNLDDELEME